MHTHACTRMHKHIHKHVHAYVRVPAGQAARRESPAAPGCGPRTGAAAARAPCMHKYICIHIFMYVHAHVHVHVACIHVHVHQAGAREVVGDDIYVYMHACAPPPRGSARESPRRAVRSARPRRPWRGPGCPPQRSPACRGYVHMHMCIHVCMHVHVHAVQYILHYCMAPNDTVHCTMLCIVHCWVHFTVYSMLHNKVHHNSALHGATAG